MLILFRHINNEPNIYVTQSTCNQTKCTLADCAIVDLKFGKAGKSSSLEDFCLFPSSAINAIINSGCFFFVASPSDIAFRSFSASSVDRQRISKHECVCVCVFLFSSASTAIFVVRLEPGNFLIVGFT